MINTTNSHEAITIDYLVKTLKINGIHSKKQIIDILENLSLKQLRELRQDINLRINQKESELK